MVAVPAAVDGDVFHRQWPRAAVLHRAVLPARLRKLHAGRRHPADAAGDLERRRPTVLPRRAVVRQAAGRLCAAAACAGAFDRWPLRTTAMLGTAAEGARGCRHPDAGRGAVDRRPSCAAFRATSVGRVIVADGGSRDATVARAQEAGAEVIDAGRGYGRACLARDDGRARTPRSWCSWMATAPTIRRKSPGFVEPIRSGRYDFVIGSRARGKREPGSIAWHQLAAGILAGWGMRLALRRALHRHVRVPRHPSRRAAGARNARTDLRLEYRNANARGAGGTAHSGNSGRLSPAQRRHFKGCGKLVGYRAGWRAHHRDVRSRFAANQAASVVGRTQASAPAFKRSVIKWASP